MSFFLLCVGFAEITVWRLLSICMQLRALKTDGSGARDGFQDGGETDANIQQTVDIIDFLTAR